MSLPPISPNKRTYPESPTSPSKRHRSSPLSPRVLSPLDTNTGLVRKKLFTDTPPPAEKVGNLAQALFQRRQTGQTMRFSSKTWETKATKELINDLTNALRYYEVAKEQIKSNPEEHLKILYKIIRLYFYEKKYDEVIFFCDEVDYYFPETPTSSFLYRILSLLELKQIEKALPVINQKLHLKLTTRSFNEFKSLTFDLLTKMEELATRNFEDNHLFIILKCIYNIYMAQGEYEEALETLDKVNEINESWAFLQYPNYFHCLYNSNRENIENFEAAKAAYNKCLDEQETFPTVKADTLYQLILHLYETSLDLKDENFIHLTFYYCEWAARVHKPTDKVPLGYIHTIVAHLYFEANQPKTALDRLDKIPFHTEHSLLLRALCHFDLNQTEDGLEYIRQALFMKPENRFLTPQLIFEKLEQQLMLLGQPKLADAIAARALETKAEREISSLAYQDALKTLESSPYRSPYSTLLQGYCHLKLKATETALPFLAIAEKDKFPGIPAIQLNEVSEMLKKERYPKLAEAYAQWGREV